MWSNAAYNKALLLLAEKFPLKTNSISLPFLSENIHGRAWILTNVIDGLLEPEKYKAYGLFTFFKAALSNTKLEAQQEKNYEMTPAVSARQVSTSSIL